MVASDLGVKLSTGTSSLSESVEALATEVKNALGKCPLPQDKAHGIMLTSLIAGVTIAAIAAVVMMKKKR